MQPGGGGGALHPPTVKLKKKKTDFFTQNDIKVLCDLCFSQNHSQKLAND
jgi:hypothetical protein